MPLPGNIHYLDDSLIKITMSNEGFEFKPVRMFNSLINSFISREKGTEM